MTGWEIVRRVAVRWNRDNVGMLTASVAYYAAVSLFPLMMILTSGLGLFLRWTRVGNDAQQFLLAAISEQTSPELRQNVELALQQVADDAGFGGPVGFSMLFFAALAIFSQFERAFATIWRDTAESPTSIWRSGLALLAQRLRAFALLIGLGCAIVGVFFSEIALDTIRMQWRHEIQHFAWMWWLVETSFGILLNALIFSLLYRLVPPVSISWSLAMRGGVVAAGTWEVGRQLLATFIIGQHYTSAYGVIGSLMAIMLWGYYSIAVVFIGAEYIQVLREYRTNHDGLQKNPLEFGPTARRVLDLSFALSILYVGSFLLLRESRSYELPQFTKRDQRHHVVVFSTEPKTQQATCNFFAPLIEVLPGSRYYPRGREMQKLLRDAWTTKETRSGTTAERRPLRIETR